MQPQRKVIPCNYSSEQDRYQQQTHVEKLQQRGQLLSIQHLVKCCCAESSEGGTI